MFPKMPTGICPSGESVPQVFERIEVRAREGEIRGILWVPGLQNLLEGILLLLRLYKRLMRLESWLGNLELRN